MGFYDRAIEQLSQGESVSLRLTGNSMRPRILSGSTVRIHPVAFGEIAVGDVVLCRVKGSIYAHLVLSIDKDRVLIGNNHGGVNGWTRIIYGKVEA